MPRLKSLQELAILKNNDSHYKGSLPDYQTGSRKKKKQERLTSYQNLLYKRALYGLNMYSKQELTKMHWEKKKRIKKVNHRAQEAINLFKQERVNMMCDRLYKPLFPKSTLAQKLFSIEEITVDPKFINTLDLKSLGITKELVIKRLIHEGILPKDFYELKQAV